MEKDKTENKPPQQKKKKKKPFFLKQPMMLKVVYALIPIAVAGVFFFGWRVLAILAVVNAVGFATEYIMAKKRGQPVSMALFVTCWLFALSLPPTVPLWIAGVGIVVGVLFGKEVFGGFGRNFANPAIVGRAFVYVCFPVELTGRFVPAFRNWPGGFAHWSFESLDKLPLYLVDTGKSVVDAVSAASPMMAFRDFGYATSLQDLFLGTIGGAFEGEYGTQILTAGSIGEGSALVILLAGIYLIATKTANWRLTLSTLIGGAAVSYLLMGVGAKGVQPFPFKLLAGAFLYVSVFMVTDPVSAPKKKGAMYAYGGFIGAMIVLLSWKSQFVAAASFAILLGNIISPLLDQAAKEWAKKKKAKKKAQEAQKGVAVKEKPREEPKEEAKEVKDEPQADKGEAEKKGEGKGEGEGEDKDEAKEREPKK